MPFQLIVDDVTHLQHLLHQLIAGVTFGSIVGYLEFKGHHFAAHMLAGLMIMSLVLDHLGFLTLPYCWHGAGAEVDRIPPIWGLTFDIVLKEIIFFFVYNGALFFAYILAFGLVSGKRITVSQARAALKGRTWIG